MKNTNIFVELLRLLNVKHTTQYAINLYKSNPHHNSLYGLSMMLSSYCIDNVAIQLNDKTQIQYIDPPFIAYAGNRFALVKQINNKNINCLFDNKQLTLSIDEFISIWSGVSLIVETNDKSIEPNYYNNKKKELLNNLFSRLSWIILFLIGITYSIYKEVWSNVSIAVFGVLLLGLYICYLLLQKQMKVQSVYADKLCSLFEKSNCNNVLESDAAKFLGLFSWSEIGFSYFVSTLFICIVFPQWISYCSWISIFALPYTLWSIWYQGFKIRHWCPMCLIIMGIFWILFIANLCFGYLKIQLFNPIELLWVMITYLFSFLITHQFISILTNSLSKHELVYEINNIKLNENVFKNLLKSCKYYEVSLSISHIIFGNPKANILITVLTNPHCGPCSKMHFRLNDLLYKTGDRYCVQYVFSSFNDALSISNKMLIATYFRDGIENASKHYDDWFKRGKFYKEEFFKQNNLLVDDKVENEYERHETWIKLNKLRTTPTILINGYELPEQYKIEDLELLDI
ncbi:vitamin K epoxide reductase family protein [Parabacteroides chinchillae]